jgi:uncharacterized protein (DUF1697 family)
VAICFWSAENGPVIEATLEETLKRHFGFPVDVIVRSQQQWSTYTQCNPLWAEANQSPKLVMLCIGKKAATDDDVMALRARTG